MLAWSRMRAPGASRAGLPFSVISGGSPMTSCSAQGVLGKGALHLAAAGSA